MNIFAKELKLGKQGENGVTVIPFPLEAWRTTYGEGILTLAHQRRGDKIPYPVELEFEGNVAKWVVSSVDTGHSGEGKAELTYSVDDKIVKSVTMVTHTTPSLAGAGPMPDAYDNWLKKLVDKFIPERMREWWEEHKDHLEGITKIEIKENDEFGIERTATVDATMTTHRTQDETMHYQADYSAVGVDVAGVDDGYDYQAHLNTRGVSVSECNGVYSSELHSSSADFRLNEGQDHVGATVGIGGLHFFRDTSESNVSAYIQLWPDGNVHIDSPIVAGDHATPVGYKISNDGTKSISSGTTNQAISGEIKLGAGTWSIAFGLRFPALGAHYYCGQLYVDTTRHGMYEGVGHSKVDDLGTSSQTSINSTALLSYDEDFSVKIYGCQNSGSSQNVTYYWAAVRIA